MNNRNRSAGNNFERTIVNELKEFGYNVKTSRAESRNMDALKVDIIGDFPFHIQCKNSKNKPDYHTLLNEMPKDKCPIIFHRQTHKATSKFVTDGDYVILKKEDFYKLIKIKNNPGVHIKILNE